MSKNNTRIIPIAITVLAVTISIAHIWMNTLGNVSTIIQNGIHYAGFIVLCVLIYPFRKPHGNKIFSFSRAIDITFGFLVAISSIYIVSAESAIYDRGVKLTTLDWIAGITIILGAIEFTRRTTGWIIPTLIIIALSYITWWGSLVPGVFRFSGLNTETVLFRSLFGDDALFGNIASISSTFVFMFILFGAFLLKSGAGEFIVNISRSMAGKLTGGPGFVAVLASGLTGTISGSAVANTASTGVITIPLMKRTGFPAPFAGGIEAAASTGGQLMPPIMGAGAFVMAAMTQISYTTIILVSILPALLYFLTVAFFVRIVAKRSSATNLQDEETLSAIEVFKQGGLSFVIPVTLLIVLLVIGYTPTYAAGYAIIACIVSSWLTPNRMGPKKIIEALELGAKNMIMTAILLCAVGLIVNVVTTAGIGNIFSIMIINWSGGSLLIALVLVALASLILGMGLPVTAAYIVLATLSAPALNQLMLHSLVMDQLMAGTLPEQARAIIMLSNPDSIKLLAGPMSEGHALALMKSFPVESLSLLYEKAFSAEVLAMTLLSAHLIIFWLSQDSNVTPPVCLAAFAAAAIAEAKPMVTAYNAWKVAKGIYFVPLLIAYTPLIGGTLSEMLEVFVFAIFGFWALSAAIEGYWENPLGIFERVLVLGVSAVLLWPLPIIFNIGALAAFVLILIYNIRKDQHSSEVMSERG